MSDSIHHECGIAVVRLLKPLSFYREKYGSARYGLHKLYLILEKMINRGQDGAGIATIKLDPKRSTEKMGSIQILCAAGKNLDDLNSPEYVFEVHGGLTYSGNGGDKRKGTYPVESDLWWFGYDCGHAGDAPAPGSRMAQYRFDGDIHRTLEYCINECELLATQLSNVKEQTNV